MEDKIHIAYLNAELTTGTVTCRLDENDLENLAILVGAFGWGDALRMALSYASANTDDMREAFGMDEED